MARGFESQSGFSDFIGRDIEEAYAKVFGAGPPVGGFKDGGKDVPTGLRDMPFVQTKGSVWKAEEFIKKSKEFGKFIPICVGEPGTKEEIIESLRNFGVWLERDIPRRQKFLEYFKERRNEIINDTQTSTANTGKTNNRTWGEQRVG